MRNFKFLIVSILCVAGVAFAVAQGAGSVDSVNSPKPQHFLSGIFVGSEAKNPLSSTVNKQAYHLCAQSTQDLAALTPVLGGIATTCVESTGITVTGCALGDRVSFGSSVAQPSGVGGQVTAFVSAADTIKVVACASGLNDGGAFDFAESVFTVCCDGQ